MLDLPLREPAAADFEPANVSRKPPPGPRYVCLVHRQVGIGNAVIEHRVEIRDNGSGELLADFPVKWASRWLIERGYSYVPATNGLWSRT